MLPHKTPRGAAALERLKVFEGMPAPYDKVKRLVVPDALQALRLQHGHRYCKLKELSHSVGGRGGGGGVGGGDCRLGRGRGRGGLRAGGGGLGGGEGAGTLGTAGWEGAVTWGTVGFFRIGFMAAAGFGA